MLQVAKEKVRLLAIIDSGACSYFMDLALAKKLSIPLYHKEHILKVHLVHGSRPSSGPVTRETVPILTSTDSSHQEHLRFDVLCSPMFPVILGKPWLQEHNIQINWGKKEVFFTSSYCLQHCFVPESKDSTSCLTVQPMTSTHQDTPPVYQEFLDVFDRKESSHLTGLIIAQSSCFQVLRSPSAVYISTFRNVA